MIDIHNHGLFGVDDGAQTFEESVEMLRKAAEQGVHAIIFTPHYRHGMFRYDTEQVEHNFSRLRPEAEKRGIAVRLGCEYHVNSRILAYLQQGRCHALSDGRYVLTEYSVETEFSYIAEWTRTLLLHGYIPVIAHAERYECLRRNTKRVEELIRQEVLIQLNADSVLGCDGFQTKLFCKNILKKYSEFVIIASDVHNMQERASRMKPCFAYVKKRYGEEVAETVFRTNPMLVIGSDAEEGTVE